MNLPLANRPKAYAELERRFHRWTALKDGRAVLDWDTAVMMPGGGAEARSEQIAALDLACHGILADPAMGDLLNSAEDAKAELDPWQGANLAEMRRLWVHGTALAPDLVEALAKSIGRCDTLWRKARPAFRFRACPAGTPDPAWPGARGGTGQGSEARLRAL